MTRRRAERLKMVFIIIGYVIILPVIVAFALIADAFTERRRRHDAENFRCTRCGNILGRASLGIADEYWRKHVQELHMRFPGARLRLVRDVWAVCAGCGAKYNYRTKDKTYILNPDDNDASKVSYGE